MAFNEKKFEILRHGNNQELKSTTRLCTEGGQIITPRSNAKCLGVFLNEDCSFQEHIRETVRKARSMASWVLRTFSSREAQTLVTLWRSLIQPVLDYCSQLWTPNKAGEIQQLETVPRYFTRQIQGMRDLNYWDRLKALRLYSQQRRRDRYRAIYIWKVLEGQVPDPTAGALQPYTTGRKGRLCKRRSLPTTAPQKIRTLLTASLAYEGPKIFNSLPKEVRDISDCPPAKFKAGLDKFLETVPAEPPVQGYTSRCRTSNTLPDQVNHKDWDTRMGSSGGPPRL